MRWGLWSRSADNKLVAVGLLTRTDHTLIAVSQAARCTTYAEYLRYAIKKNRKGWSELHNYAIYYFQSNIKNATGNYHDKYVALLLSAAFRAAGHDRAADRFNENQLKALRQTGKRLYPSQKHNA